MHLSSAQQAQVHINVLKYANLWGKSDSLQYTSVKNLCDALIEVVTVTAKTQNWHFYLNNKHKALLGEAPLPPLLSV